MTRLAPSNRLRRTWWTEAVEASGVSAWTVYNRTLLPSVFRSPAEDCAHLKRAVQVWDVACERIVQIEGPGADRLMQRLTPRDLDRVGADRCAYLPVCDSRGGMLNDPVALRPRPGVWWLSLADGDLGLWVSSLAEGGFDVRVTEPDIQTLAIQGPNAPELAGRVLGNAVRELPFFGFAWLPFDGAEVLVSRSGFSKQGGFEVRVASEAKAHALWDRLMAEGADLDVRAGCPNTIERIEGGLLSYGNDMTRDDTPAEAGLGRYVQRFDCIGGAALRDHRPRRRLMAVELEGDPPVCDREWPLLNDDGDRVGRIRSAARSEEFRCGVAIGMVAMDYGPGDRLTCMTQDGPLAATPKERFWR
ncbi:dimethylsulfoniopropionate demethylase [Jannaschia rubra]|uniref:dimethylsulfoniopropionate demethylase n=1 Tax=Jannaschia rubra TaxID=282197 RepID=UPI00249116EA|nr:dimethylsulfoniopropionate demethylase [Jannaschia rubra]